LCTTFRHRHPSQCTLIGTAEIESGKAEPGERKQPREEGAEARAVHSVGGSSFSYVFPKAGGNSSPALCSHAEQALEIAGE